MPLYDRKCPACHCVERDCLENASASDHICVYCGLALAERLASAPRVVHCYGSNAMRDFVKETENGVGRIPNPVHPEL